MAKRHNKAKQVVSIEAYRLARAKGVDRLARQILVGRRYDDFIWGEWSAILAQLKTEVSHIDRAILVLTKLAMGRGQPFLNQTNPPERKQSRR
jgi:hypothetical protein